MARLAKALEEKQAASAPAPAAAAQPDPETPAEPAETTD
jgi:hypothetical protein